jgi:hypothetical protein
VLKQAASTIAPMAAIVQRKAHEIDGFIDPA